MFDFFVITPLGFEEDTYKEIQLNLSLVEEQNFTINVVKGGVEVNCSLNAGLCLNQRLKLATRILFRIEKFPVFFFNELDKKIRKIDFSKFFKPDDEVFIKVDSKKSKLGQEKKIFAVFEKIFKEKFKKIQIISKASEVSEKTQRLYVDIYEDQCRLSYDTTGEPLYKRKFEKWNHEAPMRETIAHWGLIKMMEVLSPWSEPMNFIDPFCGSGTLVLEALEFNQSLNRSFSFQKSLLLSQGKNFFLDEVKPLPFIKYFAMDLQQEAIDASKKNISIGLSPDKVEFILGDSLDLKDSFKNRDNIPSWLITNLPYGKRVKDQLPGNLVEILKNKYDVKIMGLFHPKKWQDKTAKKTIHYPVENGGLKIFFSVLVF
ncbi:MAG: hypothetical protein L6Q37_06175 [Bdellovibrionaceae bacterium]|nr:hypothetical protein [Pseudobdellovibrionaceae bacterium]NUM57880.1 hypothetical protein [Pseudobdellovibrionaceae bacterium]